MLLGVASAFAETEEAPLKPLRLEHDQANVTVDGRLTEAVWSKVAGTDDFRVVIPDSLARPRYRTQFKIFYTERGLYLGWDMEQPAETLVRRYSSRDYRWLVRDTVGFTFDASGKGEYGYWGELALGGTQTDGTVLRERQFSTDWDGAWLGATAVTGSGWSAEVFFPWSQMAMPHAGDERRFGVFAARQFATAGERWAFPPIPVTQARFLSVLQPAELKAVNPRQQWSVFPYASATIDEVEDDTSYKGGMDLFWRPSTNFQVTATVNPDFGNVESDQVIVNLTAFETFFPEKRLFFQEGQEVFATTPRADAPFRYRGGAVPTAVINTRRIGGRPRVPDTPDDIDVPDRELGQPTELQGALKATGEFGSFRYGVLGAMEDDVKFDAGNRNLHQNGSDYGAVRLLYDRTADNGVYRGLGMISTAVVHPAREAYVHGLDFHYQSAGGRWAVDGQLLHSDIADDDPDGSQGKGYGAFIDTVYSPRRGISYKLALHSYDDTLDINDLGFLERNDATRMELRMDWRGTGIPWVRNFAFRSYMRQELNGDGRLTQSGIGVFQEFTLHNLDEVTLSLAWFPERYEDRNSFGNGAYRIEERENFSIDYVTDPSKTLSLGLGLDVEGEDLGGHGYTGWFNLVWRPAGRVNLEMEFWYYHGNDWLLHQKDRNFTTFASEDLGTTVGFDFFPGARHQFRLALQWVGVRAEEKDFYIVPGEPADLLPTAKPPGPSDDFRVSVLNFQARYRWQIAPLSDLFIVYTRNASEAPPRGGFRDLFREAWNNPSGDELTVKLRYRLGS